jgi:ribosomal protein S3
MGQKSSPVGLRLQINRTWDSRWFAEGQDYGRLLLEDLKIRKYIVKKAPQAAISKVVIERPAKICRISIYAARPGVIIGKKGADIEKLKRELQKMTSSEVSLNILKFSPKAMADDVRKVLASAVANAENNHNLDVDALVVAEASVGKSISMKRFATRARGRSSRIVKPFSQVRIVVREQEEA